MRCPSPPPSFLPLRGGLRRVAAAGGGSVASAAMATWGGGDEAWEQEEEAPGPVAGGQEGDAEDARLVREFVQLEAMSAQGILLAKQVRRLPLSPPPPPLPPSLPRPPPPPSPPGGIACVLAFLG